MKNHLLFIFICSIISAAPHAKSATQYESDAVKQFIENCVNPSFLHEELPATEFLQHFNRYKNNLATYQMLEQMTYADKVHMIRQLHKALKHCKEQLKYNRHLIKEYDNYQKVNIGLLATMCSWLTYRTIFSGYLPSFRVDGTEGLFFNGALFGLVYSLFSSLFIKYGLKAHKRYALYQELTEMQESIVEPTVLAAALVNQ
ncbi:MAG: hypothetical protein WCE21_03870 [Candidatus Babeliales bacterium]